MTRMPAAGTEVSQTSTMSWDQGYYVYSTPAATTSCGNQTFGIVACSDHVTQNTENTNTGTISSKFLTDNELVPDGTTLDGDTVTVTNNGVNTFIDVGSTAKGEGNIQHIEWWAYPGDDFAGAATGKQSLTNETMTKSITAGEYTVGTGDNAVTYPKVVGTVGANDPYVLSGTIVWSADGTKSKVLEANDHVFDVISFCIYIKAPGLAGDYPGALPRGL